MTTIRASLDVDDATSDHQRLVIQLANLSAGMFRQAGGHFSFHYSPSSLVGCGDCTRTGLLAAAVEIRDLLCKSPDGRQACADLGFEPVLQNVEGE